MKVEKFLRKKKKFLKKNKELDLRNYDLLSQESLDALNWDSMEADKDEILAGLHINQRLLRISSGNEEAEKLMSLGLSSAHQIASMPRHRFLKAYSDAIGNEQEAKQIYHRATQLKARAKHLLANIHGSVGSNHYKSSLFYNLTPGLEEELTQTLPNYQDIFGSLNYCACGDCQSILSPAAYFLDIMRITDEYITEPNKQNIPKNYSLPERRPDLFDKIKLDCKNTKTLIPYVQLINEVIERRLEQEYPNGVYKSLATATYPFNLPSVLPVEKLRIYLTKTGYTLFDYYRAVYAENSESILIDDEDIAREYLGLNSSSFQNVTTPVITNAGLGSRYGYDDIAAHLPSAGTGTITIEKDKSSAIGTNVDFNTVLRVGQQIMVESQIRTVVKIASTTQISLDTPWTKSLSDTTYILFAIEDLTQLDTFLYRTSLSFNEVKDLFSQGLSSEELNSAAGLALYINATGEDALGILKIDENAGGDDANDVVHISGISNKRLDRISRFVRLAAILNISYANLDSLIRMSMHKEIDASLLLLVANSLRVSRNLALSLDAFLPLIDIMATGRRGNGSSPADTFDLIFNPSSLLQGSDPYRSVSPIPFDPQRPLSWQVGALDDSRLPEGSVVSGTLNTVVLPADVSAEDNAYNGLSIFLESSTGERSTGVVKTYSGATKTATLYADLPAAPDNSYKFNLGNEPSLTARLSAALQVSQSELNVAGSYLRSLLGKKGGVIVLSVENLTYLYRLCLPAKLFNITVDEYFAALGIIFYPEVDNYLDPPKGTFVDNQKPYDLLIQNAAIIDFMEQLKESKYTVYELRYMLLGSESKYVKPAVAPDKIAPFLSSLSVSSAAAMFTIDQVIQAGFSEDEAVVILQQLQAQGLIDEKGCVLENKPYYEQAAMQFPIDANGFEKEHLITAAQSQYVYGILAAQHPQLLKEIDATDTSMLTSNYSEATGFNYLFVGEKDADAKRMYVKAVLERLSTNISFVQLSPLVQIKHTAFTSDLIDETASRTVFDALVNQQVPVLVAVDNQATSGYLSDTFNSSTSLSYLFKGSDIGQSGTIDAYDGVTKVATLQSALTDAVNYFTNYALLNPSNSGTALAATANTITLEPSASMKQNAYKGMTVKIIGGKGNEQQATVVSYEASTKVATIATDWTVIPDVTSLYVVGEIIETGIARNGTKTSITLSEEASGENNFYKGMLVILVEDPQAADKRDQVRGQLLQYQNEINLLGNNLSESATFQEQQILDGMATLLNTTATRINNLLPFVNGNYNLNGVISAFLNPPLTQGNILVTELVLGLARYSLLPRKSNLDDQELSAITRQYEVWNIKDIASLNYKNVAHLGAYVTMSQNFLNSSELLSYFDIPNSGSCPNTKTAWLSKVSGWNELQICQLATLLWPVGAISQINDVKGLLRMSVSMNIMNQSKSDVSYLKTLASLLRLNIGNLGAAVNQNVWAAIDSAAEKTLSLVGARYGSAESISIAEKLQSGLESWKRNAILGFAIWRMQQTLPEIQTADDLFQYLLIDVKMGACDNTSYIAQGINSVQLYMQRARMGLEVEARTNEIPEVWWEWCSSYRIWEVNRKIFLYPENFIQPAMRKGASESFERLRDDLLKANLDEATINKAYASYFDQFAVLGGLVHVAAYTRKEWTDVDGEQRDVLYLIARTNTEAYTYYVRTLKSSSKCTNANWSPWEEVGITINALFITPTYSFNRLFLFWTEIEPTKNSKVSGDGSKIESNAESSFTSTVKYTFKDVRGEWVPAQVLDQSIPAHVVPNPNPRFSPEGNYVDLSYSLAQQFWQQPYVQSISRGIPSKGTLTFSAGLNVASGKGTNLGKQVEVGDKIWVGGVENIVVGIDNSGQQLVFMDNFSVSETDQLFKVIPRNQNKNTFSAFVGQGTIEISNDVAVVTGLATDFNKEISIGDKIQAGAETRTVIQIVANKQQLVVDKAWSKTSFSQGKGKVSIFAGILAVDGKGTDFKSSLKIGDQITINSEQRKVVKISSDTYLEVDAAWSSTVDNAVYTTIQPFDFHIIPTADGSEKLVVFYGPGLDIDQLEKAPVAPVIMPNPGDDPFLSNLNELNESFYEAQVLSDVVKSKNDKGVVTGVKSMILSEDLVPGKYRFYSGPSEGWGDLSPAIYANISRENNELSIEKSKNLINNAYWNNSVSLSNSKSSPTQLNKPSGAGRILLYHVSATDSSVVNVGNQIGLQLFSNKSQSFLVSVVFDENSSNNFPNKMDDMAFVQTYSLPDSRDDLSIQFGPYTTSNKSFDSLKFRFTRLTTNVIGPLKQRLFAGGVKRLLKLDSQELKELPFDAFYQIPQGAPPPTLDTKHIPVAHMDFDGAYGLYFWEVFFHTVLLIGDQTKANQQFAQAKTWYEYIFNPSANPNGDEAHPNDRYWQFKPFRSMDIPTMYDILNNKCEIDAYNSDPFNPDAIARLRISAYAKTTAIRYISNLIEWGDNLFSIDTRESITQATNLYVLANNLLGKKPMVMGDCPVPTAMTYDEIKQEYSGNIPEFLIKAEQSTLISGSICKSNYAETPFNEFNSYFCIPENQELISLWTTIEDRLYKIRHCLNLQGVARPLSLFAPPIDPHAFLSAYTSGATGVPLASYAAMPVPPHVFSYLVQQTQGVVQQVINLGGSMLAALEKKDTEALGVLRINQEAVLLQLNTQLKEQQIALIQEQRLALESGLESARYRQEHYNKLLDEGLNGQEIAQIVMMTASLVSSGVSIGLKTASAIGYAVPQAGSPFAMTYGGQQLGANLQMAAAVADGITAISSFTADILRMSADFTRRAQEWEFQKGLATIDIDQFEAQIQASTIQESMAERELEIHMAQIEQNQAMEQFYLKKFTNAELYEWMASRLSQVYFQTYKMALELARSAQRAYQYEYSTSQEFLNFSYWDNLHKGLLAGEGLMLTLNQMEQSYTNGASRTLEIRKTISLRAINPLAFLQFVKTGDCVFELPEMIFDTDYPGHYKRKIKTLAVSIPAVVGPYSNIKATLTQTGNQIVLKPDIDAVQFLLGDKNKELPAAAILQSNVNNFQKITLSTGNNDTGMFELNYNDTRYLPFEGTGAVSSWRLSMPKANNTLNFESISDVIIELQYNATDGGQSFARQVSSLPQLTDRLWSLSISLDQQYSAQWYAFMNKPPIDNQQILSFTPPSFNLPNVSAEVLIGCYLQLELSGKVNVQSRDPYLSIDFGNGETVYAILSQQGDFYYAFTRGLSTSRISEIKLDFDLSKTPATLKEDGHLNAEVLRSVSFVFFLSGEVEY